MKQMNRRAAMSEKMVQRKINEMFRRFPQNTAIRCGDREIKYNELDIRTARIAVELNRRGIPGQTFIGIMQHDKVEVILTIIGILRAGCAFVPLDTGYPRERLETMIDTTDVEHIICDDLSNRLYKDNSTILRRNVRLIPLQELSPEEHGTPISAEEIEEIEKIENRISPDDKVYIYFTSGTTGKPKAIVGKNKSLHHFIQWEIETFGIDETYRFSQFTNVGFDVYMRDVLVPLCAGGTVVIPENKEIMLDPKQIVTWIDRKRINLMHMVPSLFRTFNTPDLTPENFKTLKYILFAGEKTIPYELENWYRIYGERIQLVNLYGPTETTLAKVYYMMTPTDTQREIMPIGKHIKGARVIILDENMDISGESTIGELYIRTPYRTYGYYNDPQMNAQKFVPNPFGNVPGDVLYKTGDLGRYLPDGNIELQGRVDRQVKIRGMRVELDEIENTMLKHPKVKEAVVVEREIGENNRDLAAIIVGPQQEELEEIITYQSEKLPDYMVPAEIRVSHRIPRKLNGKVDYDEVQRELKISKIEYHPPRDDIQKKIVVIWAELLGGMNGGNIGIRNSFFQLGGNSLNVMTLISRMHKEFDVRIPLGQIFKNNTVEKLADIVRATEKESFTQIERAEEKPEYPVSPAQKRLYLLQQMDIGSVNYNIPMFAMLEGEPDNQRIQQAFRQLIRRHEILRTGIRMRDGEPLQVIQPEVEFRLERFETTSEAKEKEIIQAFVRPFDLNRPPLIRAGIIDTGQKRSVLMLDIHHIVADGASVEILVREIMALYAGQTLAVPKIRYKDYSQWQNRRLQEGDLKKQEEYWLQVFKEEPPVLDLPADNARPARHSIEGNTIAFELTEEQNIALNKLAQAENATLFMVLLAIYNVYLWKLSGREDIVVGTPISGRRHADLEYTVGTFVNTLALRSAPEGGKSFKYYLNEVKQLTLDAFENQDYQFEELVEKVAVNRDVSRNPIFNTVFALQNFEIRQGVVPEVEIPGLILRPYPKESNTSKFDMLLTVQEAAGKLICTMQYGTRLFREQTVRQYIGYYKEIIDAVIKAPVRQLTEIDVITPEQKQELLNRLDNTGVHYPEHRTVHELFEEQAAKTPNHISLVDRTQPGERQTVTYRELNAQAHRKAVELIRKGLRAGEIVALLYRPSPQMTTAILAVLKAGGAYMPIDPGLPARRVQYMLSDSNVRYLLAGEKERSLLDGQELSCEIISQETAPQEIDKENLRGNTAVNPILVPPDYPAYVIYTSGTTGKPKGVIVEHRNVVRLMINRRNPFDFDQTDTWTQFHSYGFDFSVWEMYGALLFGGKLVLISRMTARDTEAYLRILEEEEVTVLNQTPSAFYQLAKMEGEQPAKRLNLRYVIFGGEALMPMNLKEWRLRYPGTRLINMFGITETTVHVTFKEIGDKEIQSNISNIGKPIPTLRIDIMEPAKTGSTMKLTPPRLTGELCVGGDGVARGYLNRPELTAERFISDPHRPGERLYLSGDRARLTLDGELEYLGRKDYQVKIRGYRIELAEIETRLQQIEQVKENVVTVLEDATSDKTLCAYLVLNTGVKMEPGEIKNQLSLQLPAHMVPAQYVELTNIPLTANGKVDRKALPQPGKTRDDNDYVPPTGRVQTRLAEIWAEVLGTEASRIGIHDNFFQMGGHSLKAAQLVTRIQRAMEVRVPLAEIFTYPTAKELADYIETAEKERQTVIQPAEEKQYYPLSSAQRRLVVLQQMEKNSTGYNVPLEFTLERETHREQLETIFNQLIQRHEILRTAFKWIEGEAVQEIHRDVHVSVEEIDGESGESTLLSNMVRPFDIAVPPLMRVRWVRMGEGRGRLQVDMHHLITDGVSMEILAREFAAYFNEMELPPPVLQYKDFAQWQNGAQRKEILKKQEQYWLEQYREPVTPLELPTDYPRPTVQSFEGRSLEFNYEKELTGKLKKLAEAENTTLFITLLAVTNVLLHKLTGREDIVIGTVVTGRANPDLEQVVGMFVNTLAIRNYPIAERRFRDFLREVKMRTLTAIDNQEYEFEELVEAVGGSRDISRNPLFDVAYAMERAEHGTDQSEKTGHNAVLKQKKDEHAIAKFDLTVFGVEMEGRIRFKWEYGTKLYKKETVERYIRYFREIVETVVEDDMIPIKDIKISHEFYAEKLAVPQEDSEAFGF
jgi:tyrocidine synthetase III